jgi:hypothetical protein
MKRLTVGAVIASLAVAGAAVPVAGAEKGGKKKPAKRTKVYRAKLAPVPVGDYGMLARSRGKAQLVDGKRNDKISIHVRRLSPGVTYGWRIVEVTGDPEFPCTSGTPVAGWTYKPLKANAGGNANSKGKSKTFKADPEKSYFVGVYLPSDGAAFLCGELKGKGKKAKKVKDRAGRKPAGKKPAGDRREGNENGKRPKDS